MLTQKLNINDIKFDNEKIDIISYHFADSTSNNKLNLVCSVRDIDDLYSGMPVTCSLIINSYDINGDKILEEVRYKLNIQRIDEYNNVYIEINKFYNLKIKEVSQLNSNSLIFITENKNFFTKYDTNCIFFSLLNNNSFTISGTYFDYGSLKWEYDSNNNEHKNFILNLFNNVQYIKLEDEPENIEWDENNTFDKLPVSVTFFSEDNIRVGNNNNYTYYHKDLGKINNNMLFFRDNIFASDNSDLTIMFSKMKTSINIPLGETFETNLFQNDIINDSFIRHEVDNSINDYTEMEKFTYCPVIPKKEGDKIIGYRNIDRIKFNLHFRPHTGDDWVADSNSYWNGVNDNITFMDDTNSYNKPFFSYDNIDKQSDLLCYLNFNDADIRYQKEALKKTFLRLSFYDSPNINDQNLIFYSTIFLDSGKLFSKLMRHINDGPYNEIGNTSYTRYNNISCCYEPCGSLLNGRNDDEIEDYRLSSQFVVGDRIDSSSSSEGFYIYLWADNDAKNIPLDLYMKVEFNHAGNGRKVPFMLPFFDKKSDGFSKIKTFQDVLNDWSFGGYNPYNFIKYSHIHLKYIYDNDNKQHVYYLDPDTYGDEITVAPGEDKDEIVFNLYEAKMSFLENDEKYEPFNTPINSEFYDLKINKFEWKDIEVFESNTNKKVALLNPCGGNYHVQAEYSYYKSNLFKGADDGYVFSPTESAMYYSTFNDKTKKYERIDDPQFPPLENIAMNIDPNFPPSIVQPKYIFYNNKIYKFNRISGRYEETAVYNGKSIILPVVELCTDGGVIEYKLLGKYDKNIFSINKSSGLVRILPADINKEISAEIGVTITVTGGVTLPRDVRPVESVSSIVNLKIKIKRCEDMPGMITERYYTLITDALYAKIERDVNVPGEVVNIYPPIDLSGLVNQYLNTGDNKVIVNEIYEKYKITVSNSDIEKYLKFKIYNKDNNTIGTTNFKNRNSVFNGSSIRNFSSNTYDVNINGLKMLFPKSIMSKKYIFSDDIESKTDRILGYENITDSTSNPTTMLLASDDKNFINKQITWNDVFYIKRNPITNRYVIDNNSQSWVNIINNGLNYEINISKNYGPDREAVWLFKCNNDYYAKHITQKGINKVKVTIEAVINNLSPFDIEDIYNNVKIYKCDSRGNIIGDALTFDNNHKFIDNSKNSGEYYNLIAVNNSRLEFIDWSEGSIGNNSLSIYLNEDKHIIAYFKKINNFTAKN